jgi:hypothetical protein
MFTGYHAHSVPKMSACGEVFPRIGTAIDSRMERSSSPNKTGILISAERSEGSPSEACFLWCAGGVLAHLVKVLPDLLEAAPT